MRKVPFLLALSALLVIGCRHLDRDQPHYPPDSPAILDVIVNGPCILVWTPSRPDVITLISPRDAEGLHRFYLNNLTEGTDRNVHITLAADGLKAGTKLSIDPFFPPDFIVKTSQWVRPPAGDPQKDYLVTIELPLPEKISFVSPLHQVILAGGKQSLQATNFVLEYRVTDAGKIHATHGSNSVSPLSSSDLQKKYNELCEKPENGKHFYESCANLRNLLEQHAGAKTVVLFFGVGIPLEEQLKRSDEYIEAHAVDFFNNVILQSFPKWTGPRLAPKGAFIPQGTGSSTPMLMEASFMPRAPYPHPVPVNAFYTAVIDCKAGNVIVTAQTIQ